MQKKLFTTSLLFVSLILTNLNVNGQNIEIETDPLAFAFGGGSVHLATTWQNYRFQAGYAQLSLPKSFQNHQNVKESFKSISFKVDYFLTGENTEYGFFAGGTFDIMFLIYEDENAAQFDETNFNIGIRTGYKFDLFRNATALEGLYLTPWIGFSLLTNGDDFKLSEKTYNRKSFLIFPTIHLGWAF